MNKKKGGRLGNAGTVANGSTKGPTAGANTAIQHADNKRTDSANGQTMAQAPKAFNNVNNVTCWQCEQPMEQKHPSKKYCSNRCRQAAYMARKAAENEIEQSFWFSYSDKV